MGSSTKPKRPYAERQGALMHGEEVADELGITLAYVETLAKRGEIQEVKVGGFLKRYTRASVDAYLARLTGEGR